MGLEHGPRSFAMPDGVFPLVVRHPVEDIDLKTGENRRGAADDSRMKPRHEAAGRELSGGGAHSGCIWWQSIVCVEITGDAVVTPDDSWGRHSCLPSKH